MKKKEPNKKTQILLLVLVIVIWGAVAIRFFLLNKSTSTDISSVASKDQRNDNTIKRSATPDSFTLYLDYPDPFLLDHSSVSDIFSGKKTNNKRAKTDKTKLIQSKILPQVDLTPIANECDNISLLGVMVSPEKGYYIARIKIKNKSYSVKKGDEVDGVNIVDVNKTSIRLLVNKKTECILNQK